MRSRKRVKDHTMSRTVHGFKGKGFLFNLKREHVFRIMVPVTRCLPQPGIVYVGGDYFRESSLPVLALSLNNIGMRGGNRKKEQDKNRLEHCESKCKSDGNMCKLNWIRAFKNIIANEQNLSRRKNGRKRKGHRVRHANHWYSELGKVEKEAKGTRDRK